MRLLLLVELFLLLLAQNYSQSVGNIVFYEVDNLFRLFVIIKASAYSSLDSNQASADVCETD
jgi:hypothetical protein